MAPKVDAAINLHELTTRGELSELILFSSVAGSLGSPRLGNYAAANAFLDALAFHRRAQGLPCVSLAFGLWERATGLEGELDEAERARIAARLRRSEGLVPLADGEGLEMFDAARAHRGTLLLPVRLDMAALRAQAKAGVLPAVLRGLIRLPARRSAAARGLAGDAARRGAGVRVGRHRHRELVRSHVAGVLGHASRRRRSIRGEPSRTRASTRSPPWSCRNRLSQATRLEAALDARLRPSEPGRGGRTTCACRWKAHARRDRRRSPRSRRADG